MLHFRIAEVLGWTLDEVRSFSLLALRDLVRPLDAKLAADISAVVRQGEHLKEP